MFDKHKEGAEHREDKNLFAAKSVTQMAKPARCRSTKNTLCCFDSWGIVGPIRVSAVGTEDDGPHACIRAARACTLGSAAHSSNFLIGESLN